MFFYSFFREECPDVFLEGSCGRCVMSGVLRSGASVSVELSFAAVLLLFRESVAGIVKTRRVDMLMDMSEQQVKT